MPRLIEFLKKHKLAEKHPMNFYPEMVTFNNSLSRCKSPSILKPFDCISKFSRALSHKTYWSQVNKLYSFSDNLALNLGNNWFIACLLSEPNSKKCRSTTFNHVFRMFRNY